jgi:endonuclease-8
VRRLPSQPSTAWRIIGGVPEGDTVWLAARRLHDALAGERLVASDFRVPGLATVDLSGRHVDEVVARGKHLLWRIEGGLTLHTHFRMDGTWHLYRTGQRWRGGPAWQIRALLRTTPWTAVGYRLPVVELIPTDQEARAVGHLGPDLLGTDWDAAEAVRRLRDQPDRELGEALLDQRNLAGIGNVYKTEVCFLAGVSPWTPVSATEVDSVVDLAYRLMQSNKGGSAQVTTGDPRRGHQHWVFERSGQPCRRCRTRVLLGVQGAPPYERLSYWCPHCQPGPAPEPTRRADLARPAGRSRYRA